MTPEERQEQRRIQIAVDYFVEVSEADIQYLMYLDRIETDHRIHRMISTMRERHPQLFRYY